MTRTRHAIGTVLVPVLTALAVAGCGSDSKDTATVRAVTLRIGTDDSPGKPAADQISEFARRVTALSGGKVHVTPVWHAAGDGPDWDQRVARMVTSGKLDMGLIPSRAWDTEGVSSLRALNAPFLITSDELLDKVVSGDLAKRLLSGLDKAGVVGVALFPEGLRHPFGLKKPLLRPSDYAGKKIRTPTSATTTAVFKALGATADDGEPDAKVHAGVESSYVLGPGGTATGNVTFYPKVNTLVVNARAFSRLDEAQRRILEKAAGQTRAWAVRRGPGDAPAAKAFCDGGQSIVLAPDADVAALERATRPVTDDLERDPLTKSLIAEIGTLKQRVAVSSSAAPACDGAAAKPASTATKVDGTYRFEVTDAQLRKAEAPDDAIAENHGVYTVTMSAGRSCWKQRAPNPLNNPSGCDAYVVDGDQLIFTYDDRPTETYRWRRTAHGDLRMTVVRAVPDELPFAQAWVANAWRRIGKGR